MAKHDREPIAPGRGLPVYQPGMAGSVGHLDRAGRGQAQIDQSRVHTDSRNDERNRRRRPVIGRRLRSAEAPGRPERVRARPTRARNGAAGAMSRPASSRPAVPAPAAITPATTAATAADRPASRADHGTRATLPRIRRSRSKPATASSAPLARLASHGTADAPGARRAVPPRPVAGPADRHDMAARRVLEDVDAQAPGLVEHDQRVDRVSRKRDALGWPCRSPRRRARSGRPGEMATVTGEAGECELPCEHLRAVGHRHFVLLQ